MRRDRCCLISIFTTFSDYVPAGLCCANEPLAVTSSTHTAKQANNDRGKGWDAGSRCIILTDIFIVRRRRRRRCFFFFWPRLIRRLCGVLVSSGFHYCWCTWRRSVICKEKKRRKKWKREKKSGFFVIFDLTWGYDEEIWRFNNRVWVLFYLKMKELLALTASRHVII